MHELKPKQMSALLFGICHRFNVGPLRLLFQPPVVDIMHANAWGVFAQKSNSAMFGTSFKSNLLFKLLAPFYPPLIFYNLSFSTLRGTLKLGTVVG